MHNNSQKISANEINKYCYCPYQWYYERFYGTKHLRTLQKQRNEMLGLSNESQSNFNKGLKFHNNYRLKRAFIFAFKLIILILIFLIILYFMQVIG